MGIDTIKHDFVVDVQTDQRICYSLSCKYYESKKDGKDQETIQSSTIPDQGYHMGK